MAEHGIIGGAFVRIRPELGTFRREVQTGVRETFRELGTLHVPGLERTERELNSLGATARRVGREETSSLRQTRTARQQQARDSVASAIQERRALEQSLVAYRALAAESRRDSRVQVEANRLAARSAEQLGLELRTVERQARASTSQLNRLERGAIAGSGAFRGMGRSVAFASLSFIGAYGFIGAVRGALQEAGDLENQVARSETVFRSSANEVVHWAEVAEGSLGFAKSEALEAVNSFGTMLSAMEVGSRQAAQFSEDITRVSAALSLARGEADPDRATAALRVALAGRGRALRQYGIILDETSIKARAIDLGLVKTSVDPEKFVLAQRKLAQATLALVEARAKGTPLQVAKAEDAVTAAQKNLSVTLAGTTGEVTKQAKAIAAHSIIMEQGARFIDRYDESLDTAAGRSRLFHEGISELKEELGGALLPSFAQATEGINSYIHSLREGGSRHEQFKKDLDDVEEGAHALYAGLKVLGQGFVGIAHAVGGFGNLVEILGLVYAANKALALAAAIRESRLALFILGAQAPKTAAAVVASETAMTVGAGRLATALGIATRFARLGAAAGYITLLAELAKGEPTKGQNPAGFTGFVEEVFTFGTRGGQGPKKDIANAKRDAARLRLQNYGETTIYRMLREDGYPRRVALAAIVQTREHPGGVDTAPSPEDIRITPARAAANATPAAVGSHIRAELGTLAREIESGQKITQARAKALGAALSQVVTEISTGGFGPARRAQLIGQVRRLAVELADAGAGLGSGLVASLKKDRADIRTQLDAIGVDIAKARVDMASAIGDAIKSAADAERNAVSQAKSNLNSLGASLSDFIGRFVDAQDAKATEAPSGPLAARLKRLYELIRSGNASPQLIAEANRVEHELNEQASKGAADSTERKERITRGLADLTDQLNTGKISLAKFNREVTQLLRKEGISYKAAGKVLGVAFADGFRVALSELRGQAAALVATPANLRRQGTGFETGVIKPVEVIREQTANIARVTKEQNERLRELIARRHTLLLKEQQDSHQIARAQRARTNALLATLRPPPPSRTPPRDNTPAGRRRPGGTELVGHGPDPLGNVGPTGGAAAGKTGFGIGTALSQGIEGGIAANRRSLESAVARMIRQIIATARRAARISSPSGLTHDEIGVPLGQGIRSAIEGVGGTLGDDLAGEIRIAVDRGRREATERQNASQRPRGPEDRTAFPRPTVGEPPLRTATGERGRVTERVDVSRGLLLTEERRHTRLLERILVQDTRTNELLAEKEARGKKPGGPPKNSKRATDAGHAAARNNLLG